MVYQNTIYLFLEENFLISKTIDIYFIVLATRKHHPVHRVLSSKNYTSGDNKNWSFILKKIQDKQKRFCRHSLMVILHLIPSYNVHFESPYF